ncbi:MAG: protein kinase [Bryobacteraceae bacterium]|nr:protein kinase [Bryobacteraceae bacterium]
MIPLRQLGSVILALSSIALATAQRYRLEVIPLGEELVSSVVQDRLGFLYIGTQSGIHRYDGRRTQRVQNAPHAFNLAVDSRNRIWAATLDGIFVVEGLQGRQMTRTATGSMRMNGDVLFALGWDRGAGDEPLMRMRVGPAGLSAGEAVGRGHGPLHFDTAGRLWMGCGQRICVVSDPSGQARLTEIGEDDGLPARHWTTALRDRRGNDWAFASDQIRVRRTGQKQFVVFPHQPDSLQNHSGMKEDAQGAVWISLHDGLYWEDGRGKHFSRDPQLQPPPNAMNVFTDRDGNRWLNTRQGLARWIGGGDIETWPHTGVTRIVVEADDGTRWASARRNLLRQARGEDAWLEVMGTSFLGALRPLSLAGPHTILVVSQKQELWELDTRTSRITKARTRVTPAPRLRGRLPYTDTHLVGERLSDGAWPVTPLPPNLRPRDAHTDAQGRTWVISRTGLHLRLPTGEWRRFAEVDGMLQASTQAISILGDGSIWLGYDEPLGISRLRLQEKLEWLHLPSAARVAAESTFFLREDRAGRLWRGTGAGVLVSDGEHFGPEDWLQLTTRDGLTDMDIADSSAAPDGSFWIGSANGATHLLAPESLVRPNRPITAGISSYRVEKGTLAAEAVVLSFAHTHQAKLEYRIVGQSDWRAVPETGRIVESGLWPGDYRLEVRAHATRWFTPANVAALTFTVSGVARAWWAGGGLAASGLLFGLGRWYRRRNYLRRRYQQHKAEFFRQAQQAESQAGEWPSGTILRDRYRIDRLVAQGGFSLVYEALDQQVRRRVAIKQLRPPANEPRPDAGWLRKRFAQEVAAIGLIHDPGVLPVLDYWVDDHGTPHLAFPFVDGPTLREHLKTNGPLSRQQTRDVLRAVAAAVSAAHAQSVVHCDIKPENILLGPEQPILIDFGTSSLHLAADALSAYSRPMGTLGYMAPEQLLGHYSTATDLYCFALLAFELLTGERYADLRLPMNDEWEESLRRAVAAHGLSGNAATLFAAALQYDPHQRASRVDAWARDLLAELS